ncbi:MAG: secretin N-terminal domain-containing protein [Candidatus Latescibacterota bacterium]
MIKKSCRMVFFLLAGVMFLFLFGDGSEVRGADSTDTVIRQLDFEKADVRQVMKTLSEIGTRNIILDKGVTGECTIYLRDISWKEAFVAVLKMNDLVAYEDLGFVKVLKREDFDTQQKKLLESQLILKREEPVNVHVIKIHHANARDIKTTLDPLLGKQDLPSVDNRTNSLVFTVSDSSFAVIQDIVTQLDTETRQVSIEVKMVTVDSNSLSELGFNWSATRNGNSTRQTSINTADKLLNVQWSATVSDAIITANLATLIDQNKAEIVSRPHVTTQDNEPAVISSGSQVPIITYDEARNSVIELVDATTSLRVTPHVLTDDRILLDVDAARKSAEGVGIGLRINEEMATVKMITSNGETAVIGGMRQMKESKQESGIPILQSIPLIGQVFKYTKRENTKTDLIIFITPRVVGTFSSDLSQ